MNLIGDTRTLQASKWIFVHMHVIDPVKRVNSKEPTFQGSGKMGDRERGEREKWAKIWFASLARFHHINDP